jgi:hypothetical protein
MNDKVYDFSFNLREGDYILTYTSILIKEKIEGKYIDIVIPENTILRIDNVTMGGRFKRSAVDIIFSFLVKKNKHLNIDYKIPNKISIDVYSLNGLKYLVLNETNVDIKVKSLLRKSKIQKILSD